MRLLPLSMPEIEQEVAQLDNEAKALRKEIYKMAWFMRGACSMDEAYMLSPDDREIIGDIIKENIETTKETNLPFF